MSDATDSRPPGDRPRGAGATPFLDELSAHVAACARQPPLTGNVDPERFPDGMAPRTPEQAAARLDGLGAEAPAIQALADRLDAGDRRLLRDRLAFHVLGHAHARVGPTRAQVDALLRVADSELVTERGVTALPYAGGTHTRRFDLTPLGFPIGCESYLLGVQGTFQLEQYRAPDRPAAWPRPGDVAVDAGGCLGETALWLAHETGPAGRVLTLELDPANLTILRRNLAANPDLADRITVVERALWREAGRRLEVQMAGPASTIAHARPGDPAAGALTTTLDALVAEHDLPRVDFVKMDIEGAEPAALAGARETLTRHRPRLALAAYHDVAHLWQLAEQVAGLGLGYRFALGHFTMHDEETVLYAWCDPPPDGQH